MGRTSIRNKLILSLFALLFLILAAITIVNKYTDKFLLIQIISVGLTIVAAPVFGSIFSKSIVKRLNSLSGAANEISHGDLSRDIPLHSRDEVRDLEEVFSRMVDDLRSLLSYMKDVSVQIAETNARLSTLAKKVLISSHMIDKSAKTIAKGSEEQTFIVQKTYLSFDNGLNQMEELLRQAAETISEVNRARKRTAQGEAKARHTLSQLEGVLKEMAQYTQPIFRLASKVEKVKLIISVMDNIAQKTDLLSLNASIEATRAGEAGRGFALVADEIRSMAENSKRSSEEIGNMVEDILEDNQAITMALSKTQEGINQGRETIHELVGTFSETLSSVNDISQAIREIEKVMSKQLKQMRGPLANFQELSQLANENFLSTQKTTVATKDQKEDMLQIAETMKSLNVLSQKMGEAQRRIILHKEEDAVESD